MATRTYDYRLTLENAAFFEKGRFAIGNTSGTIGEIISQDIANNSIKVKVNNLFTEYQGVEYIHCNTHQIYTSVNLVQTYSSIDGSTNSFLIPSTFEDGSAVDYNELNAKELTVKFDGTINISPKLVVYPSPSSGNQYFDIKPITFRPGDGLISTQVNSDGYPIDNDGVQADGPNTRAKYVTTLARQGLQGEAEAQLVKSPRTFTSAIFDTICRNTNNNTTTTVTIPMSITDKVDLRLNTGNVESVPYNAPAFLDTTTLTTNVIAKIENSGFIRAKNAFQQPPLVRLYDIFYPGEWYPPLASGNPAEGGEGLAWPFGFPYRFAEVRGDIISDISYRAHYDGRDYQCYPIDSGGIGLNQSGEVNEVSVRISNFDSLIAQIVEDAFIVGNCANANTGVVNFESVHNLDPQTIINHTNDPYGNNYSQEVVDSDYAGEANSAITYERCLKLNGTWTAGKQDSRDLLGGVVRIQSTFATFLDYWPEYSSVRSLLGNVVELYSTAPYRINDNVTVKGTRGNYANIKNIVGNFVEFEGGPLDIGVGTNLLIVNPDADPDAYIEDVFKVDKLTTLNGAYGEFSITSWLQYFKLTFPRRKHSKNTCPWVYKCVECQYPSDGTGTIPGTSGSTALTANGFWTAKNVQVDTVKANDVCAKSFEACKLRNNQLHFGGFIGTGRTIPLG